MLDTNKDSIRTTAPALLKTFHFEAWSRPASSSLSSCLSVPSAMIAGMLH